VFLFFFVHLAFAEILKYKSRASPTRQHVSIGYTMIYRNSKRIENKQNPANIAPQIAHFDS
jgi:hypothetical protein